MQNLLDVLRRDGDSSNTVVGIILIVMLLVFVGPGVLPQLVSNTIPFIDEGVPCTRLRTAENRAAHQSLIGRLARNPIVLTTEIDPIPSDPTATWTVRVTVLNNTIGTVPFVFDETQVIVGDDVASSGIGLIFNPPIALNLGTGRRNAGITSFPENTIRLLGPRQRCVHRINIPVNQLAGIQPSVSTVRAYYRITSAGTVQLAAGQAPIYADQGLAVIDGGYTESEPVIIPVIVAATAG